MTERLPELALLVGLSLLSAAGGYAALAAWPTPAPEVDTQCVADLEIAHQAVETLQQDLSRAQQDLERFEGLPTP